MGAGKTTVGRALAKKLNKRFIDSDHEIEARTGASIPLIFEIEGEESFRQREAEVIRDLTAMQGIVLATGGGAVLRAENREYLKARGTVVYLRASVNSILQRTSHDKNRPLLQTADPRKRIEELSRAREPFYCEVADIVIETGRPNVQSLVHAILMQLEQDDLPSVSNSVGGTPAEQVMTSSSPPHRCSEGRSRRPELSNHNWSGAVIERRGDRRACYWKQGRYRDQYDGCSVIP